MAETPAADPLKRSLSKLPLEPLKPEHLPDMTRLHQKVLPFTMTTRLGPSFVADLYRAIMGSPGYFGFACYVGGKMIGCGSGTSDCDAVRRAASPVFEARFGDVLRLMARNPLFAVGAVESKYLVPRVFKQCGTKAEGLTLLTDTDTPAGAFAALRVLTALREHFASLGESFFLAQSIRANPPMARLYASLNVPVIRRFWVHEIFRIECR